MTSSRRTFLGQLGAVAAGGSFTSLSARAESFPDRPVSLIVPYGAGGPTDQHVRAVAIEAGNVLGQAVTIENKAGANGTFGAAAMARSQADGYTLAIAPSTFLREPYVTKVQYDPLSSFTYIMLMSAYCFGLAVRAESPLKSWTDFASAARKNPGKINVGATGAIGTPRIGIEEAAEAARIQLNMVPFKSDADVTTAILGGHIDAGVLSGVAVPHIESGRMRYLAMMTEQRVKRFPDLPTLKEQGVNVWIDSTYGLIGPAGMDPVRVQTIHNAFRKGLESAASLKVMDQLNQQSGYKDPADYKAYALKTFDTEKGRVARLRQRGLLE